MKYGYYALGPVLPICALLALGCRGGGEEPTNTAHSTYNASGHSVADKIGAMRAARRPIDRGKPDAPAGAPAGQ